MDLNFIFLFRTPSQLSVLFRDCRLLHLICKFASVEFLTSLEIVYHRVANQPLESLMRLLRNYEKSH